MNTGQVRDASLNYFTFSQKAWRISSVAEPPRSPLPPPKHISSRAPTPPPRPSKQDAFASPTDEPPNVCADKKGTEDIYAEIPETRTSETSTLPIKRTSDARASKPQSSGKWWNK